MLAVVKTPRTDMRMRGFIPAPVLRVLRNEFGGDLTVTADKDDKNLESVFESMEYKEFKNRVSPPYYIRTYRENAGMTQTDLAEKLNVSRAYICDVEHGRRAISKQFAKQIADFFKIPIAHLYHRNLQPQDFPGVSNGNGLLTLRQRNWREENW